MKVLYHFDSMKFVALAKMVMRVEGLLQMTWHGIGIAEKQEDLCGTVAVLVKHVNV